MRLLVIFNEDIDGNARPVVSHITFQNNAPIRERMAFFNFADDDICKPSTPLTSLYMKQNWLR